MSDPAGFRGQLPLSHIAIWWGICSRSARQGGFHSILKPDMWKSRNESRSMHPVRIVRSLSQLSLVLRCVCESAARRVLGGQVLIQGRALSYFFNPGLGPPAARPMAADSHQKLSDCHSSTRLGPLPAQGVSCSLSFLPLIPQTPCVATTGHETDLHFLYSAFYVVSLF